MPKILAFNSSLVTLKFSVHNFLETRVLLQIFDAEFHTNSYFEPFCLPAKDGDENREKASYSQLLKPHSLKHH